MFEATSAPAAAFPGHGQARAEPIRDAALKKEVVTLKVERDIGASGCMINR